MVGVAVVASAMLMAGCFEANRKAGPATTRVPPSTTTTTKPFPPPSGWSPSPNDVEPELKQAAADMLGALFSYGIGGGSVAAARARLASLPVEPTVADTAAVLLDPQALGAADVIYPQLGGHTGTRASAMVVTRLRWRLGEVDRAEVRTIDVRLAKRSGVWRIEELASLGGDPPAEKAALSEIAERVLSHPRIELPDSARWDITSGLISDRVLEVMASLADDHEIKVSVLSAGHPLTVFGTSRRSNHIAGRAVDLWWVDGPIYDQRDPGSPLAAVLIRLMEAGVDELGAPFVAQSGRSGGFANLVHQDHLHIAFDRG